MAIKVGSLSLARVGGGSNVYRAGWAAPSGNVAKDFRYRKGDDVATHKKKASSVTDGYKVVWSYTVYDTAGKTRTITENPTTTKLRNATFSAPDNALSVKVSVTPVSKQYTYYKVKDKDGTGKGRWYSGTAASRSVPTGVKTPDVPTVSKVEASGSTLKVTVESDDPYVVQYSLWWYMDGALYKKVHSATVAGRDEVAFSLPNAPADRGHRFAARIKNERGKWSKEPTGPKSATFLLPPMKPGSAPVPSGRGDMVSVSCGSVAKAAGYRLQYVVAQDRTAAALMFEQGQGTTLSRAYSGSGPVVFEFQGEPGSRYYFRYCAYNLQDGTEQDGTYSDVTVQPYTYGTKPEAPTVWCSYAVCVAGDEVYAEWVHNSTDGAAQSAFQVQAYVNGTALPAYTGTTADRYRLPTSCDDDRTITWKVRTRGFLGSGSAEDWWSPWSETKTLHVWQQPSLFIGVDEVVDAFPLEIVLNPESPTQVPLVADVSIKAADNHWALMADGTERYVVAGEEVWSHHDAAPTDPLTISVLPGDIALTDGQTYAIEASCAMSSGLSCDNSKEFTYDIEPPADLYVSAAVEESGDYAVTVAPSAMDLSGEPAYIGTMRLSIYRIETDGTMTHLAKGIPNDGTYLYTDTHAPFGRQGYRIVAVDTETGYVAFDDVESELLNRNSIVFSWEDGRIDIDEGTGNPEEALELYWNIQESETFSPDMEAVEYIGRRHPVGAYGTQLGATSRLSGDYRDTDRETTALIRKLATLQRDIYVREPMGNGYYAMVKPTLTRSDDSPLVTAEFDVTRTDKTDECVEVE